MLIKFLIWFRFICPLFSNIFETIVLNIMFVSNCYFPWLKEVGEYFFSTDRDLIEKILKVSTSASMKELNIYQ